MAKHMEWSEERSPQWQYLLSRDKFSKRKKVVEEEVKSFADTIRTSMKEYYN